MRIDAFDEVQPGLESHAPPGESYDLWPGATGLCAAAESVQRDAPQFGVVELLGNFKPSPGAGFSGGDVSPRGISQPPGRGEAIADQKRRGGFLITRPRPESGTFCPKRRQWLVPGPGPYGALRSPGDGE